VRRTSSGQFFLEVLPPAPGVECFDDLSMEQAEPQRDIGRIEAFGDFILPGLSQNGGASLAFGDHSILTGRRRAARPLLLRARPHPAGQRPPTPGGPEHGIGFRGFQVLGGLCAHAFIVGMEYDIGLAHRPTWPLTA
jgi:hypothetical protein